MEVKDQQLERVPTIQYLMQFTNHTKVQALRNSNNEINTKILAYVTVFGLCVCPTDVRI